MKRAFRYLRIAFSVTCGIACVLLIAVWVRSYYGPAVVFPPWGGHKLVLSRGDLLIDRTWIRTSERIVDTVNYQLDDGLGRWGVPGPVCPFKRYHGNAALALGWGRNRWCDCPVDTLAFQPPHTPHHHDIVRPAARYHRRFPLRHSPLYEAGPIPAILVSLRP